MRSDEQLDRPAALVLAASVARRHYVDGASKSQIAEELHLSRFKVARLLEQARASGLVRIEIDYRGELDLDLSLRLMDELGLRHCVVIDAPGREGGLLRAAIGRAAAGLLSEIATDADVLGLVWARSLVAMGASLGRLPRCTVVQLTGTLPTGEAEDGSVELVRDVARRARGASFHFYAPMFVPDAATAQALRTQPEIARALGMADRVTRAVVGVGAWEAGLSTVADAVTEAERREMHALGVRAEVGGIQLDAEGVPVTTTLTERLIGIDADRLRAVEEVVALAYDPRKAAAVQATIRGGFVDSLVTHADMARALLDEA